MITPRQHLIAIMCDDIEAMVEVLRAKESQFLSTIEEPSNWGR